MLLARERKHHPGRKGPESSPFCEVTLVDGRIRIEGIGLFRSPPVMLTPGESTQVGGYELTLIELASQSRRARAVVGAPDLSIPSISMPLLTRAARASSHVESTRTVSLVLPPPRREAIPKRPSREKSEDASVEMDHPALEDGRASRRKESKRRSRGSRKDAPPALEKSWSSDLQSYLLIAASVPLVLPLLEARLRLPPLFPSLLFAALGCAAGWSSARIIQQLKRKLGLRGDFHEYLRYFAISTGIIVSIPILVRLPGWAVEPYLGIAALIAAAVLRIRFRKRERTGSR